MIDDATEQDAVRRLNRIEGQIRGVRRMVEERKYCIDVINQVTAVRRALEQVALVLMQQHVNTCVTHALQSNGGAHDEQSAHGSHGATSSQGAKKVEELMDTIHRFIK